MSERKLLRGCELISSGLFSERMSLRVAMTPIAMKVESRSRVDKTISKMKILTALVKGERKI